MSMTTVAILAAGGALGAIGRYAVSRAIALNFPTLKFPAATLLVNIAGSALLGLLFASHPPPIDRPIDDSLILFAGVGFCGAFTTFSSFCTDTLGLVAHSLRSTIIYFVATVAGSLGAFALFFFGL